MKTCSYLMDFDELIGYTNDVNYSAEQCKHS